MVNALSVFQREGTKIRISIATAYVRRTGYAREKGREGMLHSLEKEEVNGRKEQIWNDLSLLRV